LNTAKRRKTLVHSFEGKTPDFSRAAFIAWNAEVNGNILLKENSSIWYNATLRGDIEAIILGKNSNVQDNAVLHTEKGAPCIIGDNVTIGHSAIVHGAEVGDHCLIGMGAILLNRCKIGNESIVGAGALVTEGKEFPPRSLIIGSPAKAVREVRQEELEQIQANAKRYINRAQAHRSEIGDDGGRNIIKP
jgi:carbonic anhydrase/acetyltransferase-like protein (isoleucine patch superfamily)